jgi:hypothetical protein
MFHAFEKIPVFKIQATWNSASFSHKIQRPDLRPASVVTRFIRLHPGAQKGDATNLGSLSEPRREQNLYANPKRTAKSSLNGQTLESGIKFKKNQKIFLKSEKFFKTPGFPWNLKGIYK